MSSATEDETVVAIASKMILARGNRTEMARIATAYLNELDPLAASIRSGAVLAAVLIALEHVLQTHPHGETIIGNFRTRADFEDIINAFKDENQ